MTTKIDLRDVFGEHYDTMKDEFTGKTSKFDVFLFFVFPLVLGAGLMKFSDKGFDAVSAGIWIGALSILAGLMINVLVLLYTIKAVGPSKDEESDQIRLIKQVNSNILFSVLTALLAIILLCIVPLFEKIPERILSGAIIALLANFTFTLLMTLKRLKTLVDLRFRPGAQS